MLTTQIPVSILGFFLCSTGLAYIILKHGVDRYNIYFAYRPSKTYKKIHYSSVSFMILAIMLLQLNLVYFVSSTPNINSKYMDTFLLVFSLSKQCNVYLKKEIDKYE